MTESAPVVSVVIPVFNNRPAVLRALSGELLEALDKLPNPAEVVFVDDGSGDETKRALAGLVDVDARVRVVELVANFGQHAALSAGFEVVRGRIIVSMDADGQSDPRDIPKLIAPLDNGFDMVSGIRRKRQDPAVRQVLSRMVTWFVARMMRVRLLDIGCPFNAFTADVAKSLGRFGELRRFLKPLAVRLARRVTEVEVTHRARPTEEPKSSYSSNRIVRLLM
ncbi:MAG: glycosyltransferase family 2 protein, partial [Acidobacteria bacterium]|nr:glycosyltransferase family 2 protein [Acidobacteriota bacterium]